MATPAGLENKVAFIWKIADKLRGHLKPHEYGTVMLPTLVLFRLDAVLEPTKAADPNRVYPFLAQVSPVLARKHNARRRGRFLLARSADRAACLLGDRAEDAPCRWSDVPRNSSAGECCNAARPSGRGQAGSRTRSTTSGRWSEALVGTTAAFCAVNPAETKT